MSEPSGAAAAAHKDRTTGLVLFGLLEIAIGLFALAGARIRSGPGGRRAAGAGRQSPGTASDQREVSPVSKPSTNRRSTGLRFQAKPSISSTSLAIPSTML